MWRWILTGGMLPPLLLLCSVFFTVYLKGYPFRSPRRMLTALRGRKEGGVSSFRALTQALAGTLGVGNIVGVANAIAVGGAGAIFWMWVSAFAAMILKYAEILLGVAHRRMGERVFFGGAVYYLRDCLRSRSHSVLAFLLPTIFALLTLTDALSMGCMIQSNAVAMAIWEVAPVPSWVVGIALVCLTLPFLCRSGSEISALTEWLVPLMTLGYTVLSAAVLFLRADALGEAFGSIFRDAFNTSSMAGGVLGFLTCRALRVGTMRGLLSNEAGCGTSPTAHASAAARSASAQGVWGILEVFVDTILLCTATALVILVSPTGGNVMGNSMALTLNAFGAVLGDGAVCFLSLAVFCFGYATLLCWGGYGLEALRFLHVGKVGRAGFLLLFAGCTVWGCVGANAFVWDVADFTIAMMTAINLCALFWERDRIRRETLAWCRGESCSM